MKDVHDYLRNLAKEVKQSSVGQVADALGKGAILIDIREKEEIEIGMPEKAIPISKGRLEMDIFENVSIGDEIHLMCASGNRSIISAYQLGLMGFTKVYSVKGGFKQWKMNGFPVKIPLRLEEKERLRYQRHLSLPGFNIESQIALKNSKVLVVGVGGIGSPTSLYLAAAGVGTLGLIDDDSVDVSNLQRQILYSESSVGKSKVDEAAKRLKEFNSQISVFPHKKRLSAENVEEIFSRYDIVIDGTDNFQTRYLVNDACVKLGKINIHGSVFQDEGQISTFHPYFSHKAPCYRCVFPSPPPKELAPNCAEGGVLGVLPGIIGCFSALEAIKVILKDENNLIGKLLLFNSKNWEVDTLEIVKNPSCRFCGCKNVDEYPNYQQISQVCSLST
jgi:molybdopterin/thiamine biosynthesis adenylyltransferase/rhodanese-related sulfurtransferase